MERTVTVLEVASSFAESDPAARRDVLLDAARTARFLRTPEAIVILRWDDVRALLRDRRFAGVGLAIFDLLGIGDGPLRRWYGSLMFTNEGEVHGRLRALVQQAFVPRSVEALREETAALADELLAPIADAGQGDLAELASELPIRAMARLIGVPDEDVPEFARWSTALSPVFGFMTPEQIAAAEDAVEALLAYAGSVLDRRRAEPRDDLITRLFQAEEAGERLTDGEVADMVVNLVVGGHDTSTGQISCTLFTMLEHPQMLAAVRADSALIPSAVEETLRYLPALGAVPRVALEPIEYEGLHIEPGQLVVLSSLAANHDATGYPEPEQVLPARFEDGDVHRLMTFGGGPHFCLGAAFARMVLQESVAAVLRLPEPLQLAEPAADLPWITVLADYPGHLPVTCG
jgi:cytochrome P450